MKKLLSAILLAIVPLTSAGDKPTLRISPSVLVAVTDTAFDFNIVLLGEYPNYYIVEVLYDNEPLTRSLRDAYMGRVIVVKSVVTRDMYVSRTAPSAYDEYQYDAEISDPFGQQGPDPNFAFDIIVRAPTKEEGQRVHLTIEDLEAEFGTKKWGYVWAKGKLRVRATCPNCLQ